MTRRSTLRFRSVLAWAISLTFVLQPCIIQARELNPPTQQRHPLTKGQPVSSAHAFADVCLRDSGVLVGQVVSASGLGTSNLTVVLSRGEEQWLAKTDAAGWFQFDNLQGGAYQFHASGQSQLLRLWSPKTAPPQASKGLLVTPPADVFRGQRVLSPNTNQFFRVAKQRLTNPLVVGGVIVTAVAIPVAIHNSDDDPPATP